MPPANFPLSRLLSLAGSLESYFRSSNYQWVTVAVDRLGSPPDSNPPFTYLLPGTMNMTASRAEVAANYVRTLPKETLRGILHRFILKGAYATVSAAAADTTWPCSCAKQMAAFCSPHASHTPGCAAVERGRCGLPAAGWLYAPFTPATCPRRLWWALPRTLLPRHTAHHPPASAALQPAALLAAGNITTRAKTHVTFVESSGGQLLAQLSGRVYPVHGPVHVVEGKVCVPVLLAWLCPSSTLQQAHFPACSMMLSAGTWLWRALLHFLRCAWTSRGACWGCLAGRPGAYPLLHLCLTSPLLLLLPLPAERRVPAGRAPLRARRAQHLPPPPARLQRPGAAAEGYQRRSRHPLLLQSALRHQGRVRILVSEVDNYGESGWGELLRVGAPGR